MIVADRWITTLEKVYDASNLPRRKIHVTQVGNTWCSCPAAISITFTGIPSAPVLFLPSKEFKALYACSLVIGLSFPELV